MSNDTTPARAELPADASPETKAAYERIYAQHFPQARVAAPFNGNADAPAAQVQAPTFRTIPGVNVQIAGGPDDGLTIDERGKLVEALRKHWTGSPEDLERAISGKEAIADPAANAQREAVAATDVFSPPAGPLEYELSYGSENAAAVPADELQALDREVRSAFYSAGVPKSLAQGLLTSILETAASYPEGISDAALKLRFLEEGARLRALSGDAAQTARLATVAYQALPQDYREAVDAQYGFHGAAAQVALAAVGRALEYQKSKTKK